MCPVCKIKNIDLLPDPEPGTETAPRKDAPVILSFGYQKDQNGSTSQNNTSPEGISSRKEAYYRYIANNLGSSANTRSIYFRTASGFGATYTHSNY
jgi:hypothetical protein